MDQSAGNMVIRPIEWKRRTRSAPRKLLFNLGLRLFPQGHGGPAESQSPLDRLTFFARSHGWLLDIIRLLLRLF